MRHKGAYIWNFGGRVIPQIIFLLTNIVLARYLTPAEFGQIGVLAIFISISSTLTDAGFGGSIIKEDKVTRLDLSTVFIYNLVVSLVLYLILFFTAPLIENYFEVKGLSTVTKVLSLVFVINAWALIPKTILIRNLCFKQIAIVSIIDVCVGSLISIYGAIKGWGVYALIAYQLVYAISDVVCFEIITKYRLSFSFSFKSFKRLFSFGFYTTLCNIIDSAYTNLMTTLFGKFMSVNEAGYLYQAQKLETSATNSLAQTINTVSFPILTKLKSDKETFYNEADSLFNNFSLLLFPLFWIVVVYSKPIIGLIYGKEWEEASVYLSFLMIVGIFYVMESLTRNFIKSLGDVKILAKYTLIKRVLGVICILGFLQIKPFYMLIGFMLSTILGYVVNVYLYGKVLDYSFIKILWSNCKSFLITLIFTLVLFVIHQMDHLLMEIGIITFVVLFYYLVVLPKFSRINIIKIIVEKIHL